MTTVLLKLRILVGLLLCGMPLSYARPLEGQAVTYADFNYVNHIASSMSYVYFATTEGVIRYDKLEGRWGKPLTGSAGIGREETRRIWVDTFDDKLYIETDIGRYEYNALFGSWFAVQDIPELNSSTRHVSTPEGMFPPFGYNFMAEGGLVDPFGRSYFMSDVIDDRSGTLWIGTWGYGAATAEAGPKLIELLPYGLLQNQVNAIYDDDSLLWVSGFVGNSIRSGVTIFDPHDNRFSYIESVTGNDFPPVDVYCLEGDEKAVYIGTSIGLLVYDRELQRITDKIDRRSGLSDNEVVCLESTGDSLFVGTGSGITLLDFALDSVGYVNPGELYSQVIYDLEVSGHYLWVAASAGAYRFSLDSGRLQKYQAPGLVLFSRVYDVESCGSEVWFAADGGVLMLDAETGETEEYELATTRFQRRALAVNDKIAVVASDGGMTFVFREKDKPFSREFSVDDGLPSDQVYCLLFDGDYIWVGTDKGLTHFLWNNPDRID